MLMPFRVLTIICSVDISSNKTESMFIKTTIKTYNSSGIYKQSEKQVLTQTDTGLFDK